MVADSDSRIAWHRAQLRKNRDALKRIETRALAAEGADAKALQQTRRLVADLRNKIRQSEQIIGHNDRQGRRPLGTDLRSLTSTQWGTWNANVPGPR